MKKTFRRVFNAATIWFILLLVGQNCTSGLQANRTISSSSQSAYNNSNTLSPSPSPSSSPSTTPTPTSAMDPNKYSITRAPALFNSGLAPARPGFTAQLADNFQTLDLSRWQPVGAGSPWQGFGPGTWENKAAYIPNQWVAIPGGGVRLVSTQQNWNAIGGVNDVDCLRSGGSTCQTPWTSITASGKIGMETGYGYYEWAVKLPAASMAHGTWPATWLLGGHNSTQYEEIDFMERFEGDPQNVHFTLHYGSYVGDYSNHNGIEFCAKSDPLNNFWSDLHTFAVDWEPDFVTGYIDGVACGTVRAGQTPPPETQAWNGSAPAIIPNGLMYPIVNTAIPGDANLPQGSVANLDVFHYYYYSNNSNASVQPAPIRISNIQTDKAYYNPGDKAIITYEITTGLQDQSNVLLNGIGIYDFVGDDAAQGNKIASQENSLFPGSLAGLGVNSNGNGTWTITIGPTIPANSKYTGAFSYQIPQNMPNGIYTVWMPWLSVPDPKSTNNGRINSWENYTTLVVGASSLPPKPVYQ